MSKRCVFAVILITALATLTQAQAPQMPFSIYAGGLLSVPNSPAEFKDAYKNGFHGFVGIGFKTLPAVQFVGKIEYHSFKYDFDGFGPEVPGVELSGGTLGIYLYGVDAIVTPNIPGSPVRPYVLGGGGYSHNVVSDFSDASILTAPASQDKFYYNFGGGLQMKFLPSVDFFAQIRYVNIATDGNKTALVPISVGVKIF
jgi:hypothetical protein